MDKIEELLPGLEEFLSHTLAAESLSPLAEQRRLFLVERLDIVKLPPTLPPREGRKLSPELLKETEETSGIPAPQVGPDFAATQREIARSLATDLDRNEGDQPQVEKKVKVYDDIDTTDSKEEQRPRHKSVSDSIKPSENSDDDDDDDDGDDDDDEIDAVYEIPVARQQLSEDPSFSQGADGSSLATGGSVEDLPDDVLDSVGGSGGVVPPPLPPRRDLRFSDSGSKSSVNGEDRPPELPFRPPLPKRNEVYTRSDKSDPSEKSDKSDPEISVDGDSTSYESFEGDMDHPDTGLVNKCDIPLPRKLKKKTKLKKSKKLSKSRSSSQWEISVPFRKLDNIDISGELYHRGKLSWNRRVVAISNGCLAMYKPDRDTRPLLVFPLAGYEATLQEREGRKGYEIKLTHPNVDSHTFSVDFKDWASLWIEHVNGTSRGEPPPKYHTHLARSFTGAQEPAPASYGSKGDLSESTLSGASDGGSEDGTKSRLKGNKVMRMGSFAFRATQFFESIGKKSSSKRKASGQSSHASLIASRSLGEYGDVYKGIVEESSVSSSNSVGNIPNTALTPTSDLNIPVFSDSTSSSAPATPQTPLQNPDYPFSNKAGERTENTLAEVTHKGHLFIFSSFNRRKWGKRWCMVRENVFECYRDNKSRQCELNFLLKTCVLRRATAETHSELGLMIVDCGKEKITVEPITKEEMGPWVRVLMVETCTPLIPEGLEEYMVGTEQRGSDTSSLSVAMLKQWDMGELAFKHFSSTHDYEDPAETESKSRLLNPSNIPSPVTADLTTEECVSPASPDGDSTLINSSHVCEDETEKTLLAGSESGEEFKFPRISDNLTQYNKNKHTTDSGFYSVKGTTSDSDSGCENSSKDMVEMDCGYAMLDARAIRHTQRPSSCPSGAGFNSQLEGVQESSLSEESNTSQPVEGSRPGLCDSSLGSSKSGATSDTNSAEVSPSHVARSNCETASSPLTPPCVHSTSSVAIDSPNTALPSSIVEVVCEPSVSKDEGHYDELTPPTCSPSCNIPSISDSKSLPFNDSSQSKISAHSNMLLLSDCAEEYSVVLKRSQRSKSKSPESSMDVSFTISNLSNQTASILGPDHDTDDLSKEGTSLSDSLGFEYNGNGELEECCMPNNQESYYEPVGNRNTEWELNTQRDDMRASLSPGTSDLVETSPDPKDSTDSVQSNAVKTSTLQVDNQPPISTDIVSELDQRSGNCNGDHMTSQTASVNEKQTLTPQEGHCPPAYTSCLPETSISQADSCRQKNGVEALEILEHSSPSTSQNGGNSSYRISRSDDVFSKDESPITLRADSVLAQARGPSDNAEEIQAAIDALKDKLAQIKRRRMAVHDKRQRVSSDGERLACEKEFAALEKAVEHTDMDIIQLQTHLDIVQGQTLEAMKAAQGKKKSGSRKRKQKRK